MKVFEKPDESIKRNEVVIVIFFLKAFSIRQSNNYNLFFSE